MRKCPTVWTRALPERARGSTHAPYSLGRNLDPENNHPLAHANPVPMVTASGCIQKSRKNHKYFLKSTLHYKNLRNEMVILQISNDTSVRILKNSGYCIICVLRKLCGTVPTMICPTQSKGHSSWYWSQRWSEEWWPSWPSRTLLMTNKTHKVG